MMHRVALYTQLPEFSSKDIHNISKAVSALASWILALERYHEAVTSLEPKRKLIQDVAMKIDQAELEIRKMRTKKQGVEENLLHLKSNLDMLIRQKESIIRSFKDWEQKSKSSKQMVGVLTTAETRWLKQLSELKHSKVCLLADAMMVSCQVAYFGPYCKEGEKIAL